MKFVAMIQARCGSTRFPNKVLMDLCGKPVLQRVIERIQMSCLIEETIVVTSVDKKNLSIAGLCSKLGVRVFCGSENDVLDRYYQMTKLIQPEYVIRITADCPCVDAGLLDQAIASLKENTDYLGDLSQSLPDGLDFEIIKFEALKAAWQNAVLASEREHVTLYLKKHPEQFMLQDFHCPVPGLEHHRWTLDEPEDYQLIMKIYQHFSKNGKFRFGYMDIVRLLEQFPEWSALNAMYARNEGLAKSLQDDCAVSPRSVK